MFLPDDSAAATRLNKFGLGFVRSSVSSCICRVQRRFCGLGDAPLSPSALAPGSPCRKSSSELGKPSRQRCYPQSEPSPCCPAVNSPWGKSRIRPSRGAVESRTLNRMAMGKRPAARHGSPLWVTTADPRSWPQATRKRWSTGSRSWRRSRRPRRRAPTRCSRPRRPSCSASAAGYRSWAAGAGAAEGEAVNWRTRTTGGAEPASIMASEAPSACRAPSTR